MKSTIHLTSSLKDALALFDCDAAFKVVSLGDTWHPSSGFVDEKLLDKISRVDELLEFDYDFKGLVNFEAWVGSVNIKFLSGTRKDSEFLIQGNAKDIEVLKSRLIEKNAYHENKYLFSANIVW